jgi:DNA-3-methyladenine glycosylase II
VLGASDEELRALGLSAPKIRTLRAIAAACRDGALPFEALPGMTAEEAHGTLTALKGVGPWTADIYLLFCLGHPDAFPAGDLALQEAARPAFAQGPGGAGGGVAALARGRGQGVVGLLRPGEGPGGRAGLRRRGPQVP